MVELDVVKFQNVCDEIRKDGLQQLESAMKTSKENNKFLNELIEKKDKELAEYKHRFEVSKTWLHGLLDGKCPLPEDLKKTIKFVSEENAEYEEHLQTNISEIAKLHKEITEYQKTLETCLSVIKERNKEIAEVKKIYAKDMFEQTDRLTSENNQAFRTQAEEIFSEYQDTSAGRWAIIWLDERNVEVVKKQNSVWGVIDIPRIYAHQFWWFSDYKQKFLSGTGKAEDSSSPEIAGNMGSRKKVRTNLSLPSSAPAKPDKPNKELYRINKKFREFVYKTEKQKTKKVKG